MISNTKNALPAPSEPVSDLDEESSLVDTAQGPALVGTVCRQCGMRAVGRRVVCSRCVSQNVVDEPLARTGILYTFTTLHVGATGSGLPRVIGYVDLDDGVRVLADVRAGDASPTVGSRVEMRAEGAGWFFEPASDSDCLHN